MIRSKVYGSAVREFEAMLSCHFDNSKVISVCNATVGILGVLYALELCDSEVVTTPLTWSGALTPFKMLSNTIVFGDIEEPSLTLNPDTLEDYITPKTKAIFSADFLGYPCRLDKIKGLCEKHNLLLIHDAASSMCTKYRDKYSGSYADVSIYSFGRNKPFSIGEGGAVVTRNDIIYQKLIKKITHPERQDIECDSHYPFALNTSLNPLAIEYGLKTFNHQMQRILENKQRAVSQLSICESNPLSNANYYKPMIKIDESADGTSLLELPFMPLNDRIENIPFESYKIIKELCLIN
jgi:dTDP-4-amino-4,6-dideoxygalactose transaminase